MIRKIFNLWFYRTLFVICLSFFCYRAYRQLKLPSILQNKFYIYTKTCYSTIFFNFDNFKNTFKMIDQSAKKCSTPFKDSFDTESKTGSFGIRYIATAESEDIICNVVTLGLQNDIIMEEHLLLSYPRCTFLGVDMNDTLTFVEYKTLLNGTTVQAKVGVENKIIEKHDTRLNEFSLNYIFKTFYHFKKIDFFFMDINGTEIELFHDMIENHETFPQICQFTLVIHNPTADINNLKFLKAIVKTLKIGPYMLFKIEDKSDSNEIFEIFFINVLDEICVKKYIL